MRRYVNITDIRGTRSWAHHPSARLYMYLCMTCDWTTGRWVGTRRRVALELGLTDQEYRTALKNLQQDGLIESLSSDTAELTQRVTQELTQRVTHHLTQRATQITVVIYKELGGGVSPKEQPNGQPNSQPKEQPQNNNNKNNKTYGLSLARMCAPSLVDEVAEYIHGNREDAVHAIRAFLDAMAHKGKTWTDQEDFRAHLMDWTLKRWMGVESRLSAANKAQARAERDQRAAEISDAKKLQEEREKFIISWLDAVTSSTRARDMVLTWHTNGRTATPEFQDIAAKWANENPEKARLTWQLLDCNLIEHQQTKKSL